MFNTPLHEILFAKPDFPVETSLKTSLSRPIREAPKKKGETMPNPYRVTSQGCEVTAYQKNAWDTMTGALPPPRRRLNRSVGWEAHSAPESTVGQLD